jgi:ATP-dependent DNA helicase RecG
MTRDELEQIVAGGETERAEFKRSTGQRTEAIKTVCAMLNGIGGYVLFGVANDGALVGQITTARTLAEIANELRRLDPPAFPDIFTVPIDRGRSVIALVVSGGGGPYTYDGRPYLRIGPTTSVMLRDSYERLLLERMHAARRWENQPAEGIAIDDLDHVELVRTVEEAIRRQRLEDPGTRDPVELLTGLGLLHHGRLLNAAVVLFGKSERILPRYPQCTLRMARFKGRDKTEFLDNRQETGNTFDLFVRAQRFLRDHLPVAGRIVPDLFERVDDPLYPPAALREALANALCHRDYAAVGGSVSIAIFDDRLEIASTGRLPFGLTPDDLIRPHPSRPWNPLIAQVFYRRGLIEAWGRGTIKMVELTREAGLVAPQFEVMSGEFVVRFFPTSYLPPTRVGRDLSPLQQELLTVLASLGPANLRAIHSALGSPAAFRTVQENLAILRTLGLVDSSGRGRGSRWMLKGVRS